MSSKSASEPDLIDEFVEDALLQGLSEGTLATYESNLRYFFEYTNLEADKVEKSDLKSFLYHLREEKEGRRGNENGVARRTINAYFSALSSFYDYLVYEEKVGRNPIPPFRERYLRKNDSSAKESRQLISVSEMSGLVIATLNTRNKAIILLLAKTGIRRKELILIDVSDIDWEDQSIKLKPRAKRSNRTVFFDGECARYLKKWMKIRKREEPETDALFINQEGNRLLKNGVYNAVTNNAERVGLHDPDSDDLEERFTPHCCRHWFTTHLRRSGMKREYIKELRGDKREQDSMDVYNHIDREELREAYLAHIPKLNI
ncbi:tyrosine-type recombinase/integrase [Natrarchaeobaculum sulfurireducens]|uniref:XerD/XerC family integrase n=1 Tax=Natrarchaeobaculum sulfurireducens TaxID=2044521 RepID=A0A346PSI7_9EURY|nr:tyrosine-type recombinase/integrase [Natrarchaeobaculum sulfurireducens]AXR82482.1 XerD/XerC family integrase [Natrarchaeobaculum sulfurireducens]